MKTTSAAQTRYRKRFGWHFLPDDPPPHSGYFIVTKRIGYKGERCVDLVYYEAVTKMWLRSSGEIIRWKWPPAPCKW